MKARLAAATLTLATFGAAAQTTRTLGEGGWREQPAGDRGPDARLMDRARRLLADDKPGEARSLLTAWLDAEDRTTNPYQPEAFILRGDARLAESDEEDALRDYEKVVKNYPGSEQFVPALERELSVARLYLSGRHRKALWFRIESGKPLAEEIIIRINERLPGSRLAEDALIELADYYYQDRDLKMAAEAYDVFLSRFPKSDYRARALQRRAFSSIARFKGPRHDASGLIEARYQIEDFQREYPADAERLGMSDALIARLDDSAGEQLLTVGMWYLRRGEEASARLTLGRLLRQHPGTAAARQALKMFEERTWTLPGSPATPASPVPEPAK